MDESLLQGLTYRRFSIWSQAILETMFSSGHFSLEVSRKSKKTHLQLLRPPQNEPRAITSGPRSGVDQFKEPGLCKNIKNFKNIGCNATTLTYINVWIPFNFTQIMDIKNVIEQIYAKLLADMMSLSNQ
jgi:hypothetical protein